MMLLSDNISVDSKLLSELITSSGGDDSIFSISTILDNIDAVICAKDLQGRHFIANKCYQHSVGVKREDVLGKTDREIFVFSPETAEHIRQFDQQVISEKKKVTIEEEVPNSKGHSHYYLTQKAPIFDSKNKVIGVMCLAVDISKQKRLELNLKQATKTKNLFLAKMSHEIRTPISAISGYLDLIKHSDSSKHDEYHSNIEASVDHLLNLVNDILDISSIEVNQLKLDQHKFNLVNVIESVLSNQSFKASANNIDLISKFTINKEDQFIGDETRVKQIIFNLVSNAIKFSRDAPVEIRVSSLTTRTPNRHKIMILVRDHGIGLNTHHRNSVFKVFKQLKSSEKYFEGTGLGLAIVKEIALLMGGNVKLFSTPNRGTIVAVSLYLDKVEEEQVFTENRPTLFSDNKRYLQNKVICIVEDQAFNREILKYMARSEGAKVIAFADGDELIKAIEQQQFPKYIDCFLLDIHMPILCGPDTLKILRTIEEYKETPAYFITADAIKSNLEGYKNSDYNLSGIFIKPIERNQLISCCLN